MRNIRFWVIISGVWLTFFFNIERILFDQADANIFRADTYIFVAVVAVMPLLLPKLSNLAFASLLVAVTTLFLVIWYQDPRWGNHVAADYAHLNAVTLLVIIQIIAIILSGLLTRQISYALEEFEGVIANIIFGHIGKRPIPFGQEQSEMYREVRRAARYERPLAMIALKVDAEAIQVPPPRIVKDVQQAMMKEFTMAEIARVLDENLFGFDTIALRGNYFFVLLPETETKDLPYIAHKLKDTICEEIDIPVQIGTASFPEEAITFESLVELAVDNANRQLTDQVSSKNRQQTVTQER